MIPFAVELFQVGAFYFGAPSKTVIQNCMLNVNKTGSGSVVFAIASSIIMKSNTFLRNSAGTRGFISLIFYP